MTKTRRLCYITVVGLLISVLLSTYIVSRGSFALKQVRYLQVSCPECHSASEKTPTSPCDNSSNNTKKSTQQIPDLFVSNVSTNLKDWSFTKRVYCPNLNYTIRSCFRQKLVLKCNVSGSSAVSQLLYVEKSEDIFTVPFDSKCLSDFIKTSCHDDKPVPNVVHYVWCKKQSLGFFQFLSFMSVLRFIKPCLFLMHGDYKPYGKYWEFFVSMYPRVIHVKRDCPTAIGGKKLGFFEHGTDIMRIQALIAFGGIYVDWDEIVLRSVEPLRKYKYTQGYETEKFLGSQFVMSERNASFLNHWYKNYFTNYNGKDWNYNALTYPGKLAKSFPDLIHVEGHNFTRPDWSKRELIFSSNYNWSINYAMHLFIRAYKKPTDESVVRKLNTTIGAVARHVLFGNKELCIE